MLVPLQKKNVSKIASNAVGKQVFTLEELKME